MFRSGAIVLNSGSVVGSAAQCCLHIWADPALTVNKVSFLLIPDFYYKTKQKGLHADRISIFTA